MRRTYPALVFLTTFLSLVPSLSAQNLQCLKDSQGVQTCDVGGTPLLCASAVGVWGQGPLDTYEYSWYVTHVETQDAQGDLTGYFDDGWDPFVPLTGHYDSTTGKGWWVLSWPATSCTFGGSCTEIIEFVIEPPGCNTYRGFDYLTDSPDSTWDNIRNQASGHSNRNASGNRRVLQMVS